MNTSEEKTRLSVGRFDTPKKLNRSSKEIPADIIDAMESGVFTSEMFNELKGEFPVFHYKTCITIHGRWPEIRRDRIGGYKNVIQNQNGSVEIRYSAIDRQKIRTVLQMIVKGKYGFVENSNERAFVRRVMVKSKTKEDFAIEKESFDAEVQHVRNEIDRIGITGQVVSYYGRIFGAIYHNIEVFIYTAPAGSERAMAILFSGLTEETYDAEYNKMMEERRQREEEYRAQAQEAEKRRLEMKIKADSKRDELAQVIAHLSDPDTDHMFGVVVNPVIDVDGSGLFKYRRVTSGSFGRFKVEEFISSEFITDLSNVEWRSSRKQLSKTDLVTIITKFKSKAVSGFCKPQNVRPPIRRDNVEVSGEFTLIDYSDKAVALFGDTKPIKDSLKSLGGRFNPFLNNGGVKMPGWIFKKENKEEVARLVKLN